MRRVVTVLVLCLAIGAALYASGALQVQLEVGENSASATDAPAGTEEQAARGEDPPVVTARARPEAFWRETPEAEAVVPQGVPGSFADLAARVSQGVVNIKTTKTISRNVPRHFEEFFFGGPFEEMFREREFEVPSLGSGFVISEDGYIATNNHVIEDVDEIVVVLADGTEYQADVVGRDPKTDVALIRIEAEDLYALPLGDSETVRPGDWVVAIGNPFGLEHTVTAGIVSAKHRIIGQGSYDDFIQTDAAINPGNSGGPLINLRGEVVGINTAMNPRAKNSSIGFAVPVNLAKEVLPQLKATGHVTRGWLGVVIQRVTPEIAQHMDLEADQGALVSKVIDEGPAAEAGLERGDVIVEFDGQRIEDWNDLPRVVARTPVGKEVEVEVLRDGDRETVDVEIGKLEEPTEVAAAEPSGGEGTAETFGMRVQDVTPEIADQLGLEEPEGVVITGVEPGSAASKANLRRGDVILEVDRSEVGSVDQLQTRLTEAGEDALLLVRRGDATLYVPIEREQG